MRALGQGSLQRSALLLDRRHEVLVALQHAHELLEGEAQGVEAISLRVEAVPLLSNRVCFTASVGHAAKAVGVCSLRSCVETDEEER